MHPKTDLPQVKRKSVIMSSHKPYFTILKYKYLFLLEKIEMDKDEPNGKEDLYVFIFRARAGQEHS